MELKAWEDTGTLSRTVVLKISHSDFIQANLDESDWLLLEDCDKADATVADKLLALELIARRIEEAQGVGGGHVERKYDG